MLKARDQGVIQCPCELPPGYVSNRSTVEELARALETGVHSACYRPRPLDLARA